MEALEKGAGNSQELFLVDHGFLADRNKNNGIRLRRS